MRDTDLYVIRHTDFEHIKNDATAAEMMSNRYGVTASGIRGRLSRLNKLEGKTALVKHLSQTVARVDPAQRDQAQVIQSSEDKFADQQCRLIKERKPVTALFVSDLHVPYQRNDVLLIVAQIAEMLQPAYISAMNDALDNNGYGRWDDKRGIESQRWSANVDYMRATERAVYDLYHAAAPDAMLLAVAGNHDNWYFNWLREHAPQIAEREIADYLADLHYQQQVQVFAAGRENHLRLSPNLVWTHGLVAGANPMSNGKKMLQQFVVDGQASTVVMGHTHRPIHIPGNLLGYNGVDYFNSGTCSRVTDVPYLKADPTTWGLAVVRSTYLPGTRQHKGELIRFEAEGSYLVAEVAGKKFSTLLDLSSGQ